MIVLDCGSDRTRHVTAAVAAMRRGDLVLVPTESSYALATDAFVQRGTRAMRAVKQMAANVPLPVMVPAATTVAGLAARVPAAAQDLMTGFWPGPLTLLLPAQSTLAWDHPPGAPVAVRMPLHPVLLAVLREMGPTVVTAANAPGLEPPLTVVDAAEQLGSDAVALALDVGPLADAEPSTVVDLTGPAPVVRRVGAVSIEALRKVVPEL